MTKKKKKTIKKNSQIKKNNKNKEKTAEEIFGDLQFSCDCTNCLRKCN